MESIYEYGSRAGFWRLFRMLQARNIRPTVYAIATAMQRSLDAVAAMKEAGWELATHGLKWIEYKDFGEADERAHILEAIRIHTEVAGERPLGFYQGRCSENTTRIVMEEGGFLYTADSYADDLPYWIEGPHGPQLVVPYTLDANDMRFATPQGFNAGDQFFAYLKDSFDILYAEGETAPKMMSIGLHCRLAGRPGRAAALARFLDYASSHPKVWFPTRLDIARHWIAHHPPPQGYRPTRMPRALFVERFGSVFEHSPWIADETFARGLGPDCDSAEGLHKALLRTFLDAPRDRQMQVVNAHPDLAGRLALAGKLTADSTNEQASAGLDRLTPEELARFTALNDAYRAKFGMVFIMAVKGRSKAEILEAFERRLSHTPEQEHAEALSQIGRIARLRLDAMLA